MCMSLTVTETKKGNVNDNTRHALFLSIAMQSKNYCLVRSTSLSFPNGLRTDGHDIVKSSC